MPELDADVARLVEDVNYAHIATLLPDGSPHSVPVWIDREGDRLAVLTGPGSRKARNIARDPRVAISIVDHAQPYATALIRGRVTEVLDGDEAWRVIDRIATKYTGAPYPLRSDRVVLLIEPDRAQAPSFG
ncbi:pyridoxamine 5'-phosphate oxidase family protein [Dactylosporangium sp. NPDC000521]|uniref:pyridoxamine 5'-phosphate oxidase family protein n=1 Tax=Dactylosporangium sp. NPDC000521 TaxID=3363975 RepID=UPI00368C8A48